MNSCIVKPHYGGLFSNINKVLTCMRMYEHVHVDWREGSHYGDCWNDLFEPRPWEYAGTKHDVITDYPFYDLTSAMAGVLYQNESWGWRQKFHPLWKRLGCKLNYAYPQPKNCVGVLVRCNGLSKEQIDGKSQSYEEYSESITESGYKNVFLMAQDVETIDWFSQRFPTYYPSWSKRNSKRSDIDVSLSNPQNKEDAVQVMREILTITQCDALIHPISNMATCALIINPNMKSIYLK